MSRKATDWVWKQNVKPATLKLLLLSFADRADENNRCFPSYVRLVKDTGLNRKTIIAKIQTLIEMGVLIDTGDRKGSTKQVKVFQINIPDESNTENGTVPKTEEYRFYHERVPLLPSKGTENGTQNQSLTYQETYKEKNIKKEKSLDKQKSNDEPKPTTENEPTAEDEFNPKDYLLSFKVDEQIADDWLEMRKSMNIKPTKTAINGFIKQVQRTNLTLDDALEMAILNNWRGFNANWVNQNNKKRKLTLSEQVREAQKRPPDPNGWYAKWLAGQKDKDGNDIIPF